MTLTIPHWQVQMAYCQTLWWDMTKSKPDQDIKKVANTDDTLIFIYAVAVNPCTMYLCKIIWRMKNSEPTNYDVWSLVLARIKSWNGMIKDLIPAEIGVPFIIQSWLFIALHLGYSHFYVKE